MNIAIWIVSAVLALAFLAAGGMKLARDKEALATSGMKWTEDFSAGAVKAIGALEVLGGLGLILPLATGIAPVLAPFAAVGLTAVMIGAAVVHLRRKETPAPALVLALLAATSAVLGFLAL